MPGTLGLEAFVVVLYASCLGATATCLMRKAFQSPEFKLYSERRAAAVLKARQRQALHGFRGASYPTLRTAEGEAIVLKAPSNFSLRGNPAPVTAFFERLEGFAQRVDGTLFLDMTEISKIGTGAILYLLSRLDFIHRMHRRCRLTGNLPRHLPCRQLVRRSGFLKHVVSTEAPDGPDPAVFSIVTGHQASGETARDVIRFALSKLKSTELRSRSLYETIIEAMANTRNHAFGKHSSVNSRWWLMAYFEESARVVHFSFLDSGAGIPSTIRRNWPETVRDYASRLGVARPQDAALVLSALRGDTLRTETGLSHRGRGLPRILKIASTDSRVRSLTIISRKAYIECKPLLGTELEVRFRGTLLYWQFA